MVLSELPIGLALIVCDNIIEDIRSRKKSMIGLFSQIHAESFPYTHPSLNMLVSFTGCIGDFPCTIVCEHVEDHKVIFSVNCGISAKSPIDVVDVVIAMKAVTFPVPGRYSIKAVVDDIPIMMRPLMIFAKTAKTVPPRKQESEE